jgi:hypothetical protein
MAMVIETSRKKEVNVHVQCMCSRYEQPCHYTYYPMPRLDPYSFKLQGTSMYDPN